MYRGYPIGYLLFWKNMVNNSSRTIGESSKQKVPSLVIVDGQQRLTSLYAVIKGVEVLRNDFRKERIRIAFNPLEEVFEVSDAAIERDKQFVPDITKIWDPSTDFHDTTEEYLEGLSDSQEIIPEEKKRIRKSIMKLQQLLHFPFTALELAANITEEEVAEVFVRINSKGTSLNQADFILTLMSVFWDEGRSDLERFSRDSRQITIGKDSPFNHFIQPMPDQLLRVSVGLAFQRARLNYVYSILRGKDLQTEKFSEERRIEQFQNLQTAQMKVLNLQYWHDFLACLRQVGFRSKAMISSNSNLLFAYLLNLLGRTQYQVQEKELRKITAQWFFMSGLTGRFTDSPESKMESDLASLRGVKDANEFIGTLEHICSVTLTSDYWTVSLPNNLATSASRSPSLFAFQAAQVILNARVLFSDTNISDLLDPSIQPPHSAIERHHLFPKAYLRKQGITETSEINQIANLTFLEWGDNNAISDLSPSEYFPRMDQCVQDPIDKARMYYLHALPDGWEWMDYKTFLHARREMMAQVIREGYNKLAEGKTGKGLVHFDVDIDQIIANGESSQVEFKSTIRTNLHTDKKDPKMEMAVLKTIAGFLNTNGGTLIIGVADDGYPIGIGRDGFPNEDKVSLHLVNLVNSRIGPQAMIGIHPHFEDYRNDRVMVIQCNRSQTPLFVIDGNNERFFIRTGPATVELSPSRTQEYIQKRFIS